MGRPVTARNAPQIHCQSAEALALCETVYAHLKVVGLTGFEMPDDLSVTPQNIYHKIQYGGLLGLQAMGGIPAQEGRVADIRTLIDSVTDGGDRADNLPYGKLVPLMKDYRLKRRRDRSNDRC